MSFAGPRVNLAKMSQFNRQKNSGNLELVMTEDPDDNNTAAAGIRT